MKPSVVSRALRTLLVGERQPVFIWGSPGTGKSAVLHQLAAELGIALRDIRALLLDPVDLRSTLRWEGWPVAVGNAGLSPSKWRRHSVSGRAERCTRDGSGQLLSTRVGSQAR